MIKLSMRNDVPNQQFSVQLDNVSYKITLRTCGELTLADIYAAEVLIIGSVICRPQMLLIPYPYLTQGGNFYWRCVNKDYPYYTLFGKTQELYYLSDNEIAEVL